MKRFVCLALTYMPSKIVFYITANCWFLGSFDDAYAFTFTGNDLRNKHLIFISDDLLNQKEEQILYTIVHEIGHVMLGHENSVFRKQSKAEIKHQEKEAHEFATKFLSSYN